jgi:tetratricopeptide (TPR) repeat protein
MVDRPSLEPTLDSSPQPGDVYAELARSQAYTALFGGSAPAPTVGRFTILGRLGAGGMGEVYSAYDPELDRAVAIKLLSASKRGLHAGQQARLLREARAMAKIDHPNVVPIFDVGTLDGGGIFIAMALVKGKTLSRWLEERPDWPDVVDVFIAAARGLQAAHEAGVIHRDFKPDNAMLGEDGRLQVMDFGVARAATESGELAISLQLQHPDSETHQTEDDENRLTRTGALMGTPAFMSPEQIRGEVVDEAADQFSFCVALWQGLFGTRPFEGNSLTELYVQQLEEAPTPPEGHSVPAEIVAVLRRGLDPDPSRRWPTMEAVAAELETSRRGRKTRWRPMAGIAGVGAVVLGIVLSRGEADRPCTGADEAWGRVMDDATMQRLDAAMDPARSPLRQGTLERMKVALDDYGGRWARTRQSACEATRVEEVRSEASLDASMACLDERADRVRALVRAIEGLDDEAIADALSVVLRLPGPEPCNDPGYLQAAVPPPEDPAVAASVREYRRRFAEIDTSIDLGDYNRAVADFQELGNEVDALGYAPLRGEYLWHVGAARVLISELEPAREDLTTAYFTAREAGHHEAAMGAAISLAEADGFHGDDPGQARLWVRHARAEAIAAELLEEEEHHLESVRGVIEYMAGRNLESKEHLLQALKLGRQQCGRCVAVASHLHNLAATQSALGERADAIVSLREAYEIQAEIYPPEHPELASTLKELGLVLDAVGRYDEALDAFQRSLEVRTAMFGLEHISRAQVLASMSPTLHSLGRTQEAIEAGEEAIRIFEKTAGPESLRTAAALNNLAWIVDASGDLERATELYLRAMKALEAQSEPHAASVAGIHNNLASVALRADRFEEAENHLRRSIELREAANGPDDPQLIYSLDGLAKVMQKTERPDEALPLLERCVTLARPGDTPPELRAWTRLRLGETLRQRVPDRALSLAEEALELYGSVDGHDEERARAQALVEELGDR